MKGCVRAWLIAMRFDESNIKILSRRSLSWLTFLDWSSGRFWLPISSESRSRDGFNVDITTTFSCNRNISVIQYQCLHHTIWRRHCNSTRKCITSQVYIRTIHSTQWPVIMYLTIIMLQEYSNPPTYITCPQNPNEQIHVYSAEEALKLLNSHDHELKPDHLVEIQ